MASAVRWISVLPPTDIAFLRGNLCELPLVGITPKMDIAMSMSP